MAPPRLRLRRELPEKYWAGCCRAAGVGSRLWRIAAAASVPMSSSPAPPSASGERPLQAGRPRLSAACTPSCESAGESSSSSRPTASSSPRYEFSCSPSPSSRVLRLDTEAVIDVRSDSIVDKPKAVSPAPGRVGPTGCRLAREMYELKGIGSVEVDTVVVTAGGYGSGGYGCATDGTMHEKGGACG